MNAAELNEIVEIMKSREHTAESIAKNNALQALTAAKKDRPGYEKTAHTWLARAETWQEAWKVLVSQANEFFMAEDQKRSRRKK